MSLLVPVSLSVSKDGIANSDHALNHRIPAEQRAEIQISSRVKGLEIGKVSLETVTLRQFSLGPGEAKPQGFLRSVLMIYVPPLSSTVMST